LDHRLGTKGSIERAVGATTDGYRQIMRGPDLFTFLQAVQHLSLAVEHLRRNPELTTRDASELAVSLSIHLASSADRLDLVESFESGQTDFSDFTSMLAASLEQRGVVRAAEFCRAANQSFEAHALWQRTAARGEKRIVALSSAASAGLACVLFVEGLHALGRYRSAPYAKLVPVVARTLERLGGQP
jgi:hypothetical protein